MKRRKKQDTDYGADLLAAHSEVAVERIDPRSNEGRVRRARRVDPLEYLFIRNLLSRIPEENRDLFDAGRLYQAAYEKGLMEVYAQHRWEPPVHGKTPEGLPNWVIEARERYHRASHALGPLKQFTDAVLLEGRYLREIEQMPGWSQRKALHTLRISLNQIGITFEIMKGPIRAFDL